MFAQFTARSNQREELTAALNANGIPTSIHYPKPLHLQKCYQSLGYKEEIFQWKKHQMKFFHYQ